MNASSANFFQQPNAFYKRMGVRRRGRWGEAGGGEGGGERLIETVENLSLPPFFE